MNIFAIATKTAIEFYGHTRSCKALCGAKPFGSRHWEYPWSVEQSGILNKKGHKILDIAPDLTFPYANYLQTLGHDLTFIDIEKRNWSRDISWGIDQEETKGNFHIMDIRKMSFSDNTFDYIFCISVLEHIVCPTQDPDHPGLVEMFDPLGARPAILEMKRCLKHRGKLMITVDLYGGPKWETLFSQWDILSDLAEAGFLFDGQPVFDRDRAFSDPETFISEFHGPYITLGFKLEK